MKILVLGAGGPAGINFIKSLRLAKRGYFIVGTDCNPYHIEFMEPFVDKSYLIHKYNHNEYINDILEIIKTDKIDIVYPQSDNEVYRIGSYRNRITETGVRLILPDLNAIVNTQSKLQSGKMWKDNPPYLFSDPVKINEIKKAFELLKTKQIWVRASSGAGGKAAIMGDNIETVYHWIRFWQEHQPGIHMISQRYIEGQNIAWQSVWYQGDLITSQARERLEYIYPNLNPSGITGTPVVARTINDPAVNIAAVKAVNMITKKPHGVFSIDMIKTKDGVCHITEINPGRFFTTSYFFALAGYENDVPFANMPNLLMYLATDDLEMYKEEHRTFLNIKNIPQINILPADLYYLRHIDIPERIVEGKNLINHKV